MLSRKSNYLSVPELYEQVRRNCRTGCTFYCLCPVTRLFIRAELYFTSVLPVSLFPRSSCSLFSSVLNGHKVDREKGWRGEGGEGMGARFRDGENIVSSRVLKGNPSTSAARSRNDKGTRKETSLPPPSLSRSRSCDFLLPFCRNIGRLTESRQ